MSSALTATVDSDPMNLARMRRAPSHPGVVLAELLRDAGVTQAEAARRLGIHKVQLNKLRLGYRPMSMKMCVLVGALTGSGPEMWATLQMRHDLWHATREHAKTAKDIAPIVAAATSRPDRVEGRD